MQAVALDPATYEHVDPAVVGNARHILVSELSGRNNVIERARELGVELDPASAVAREVARKIKELESEGFQFEDAEASFELLVRRAAGGYQRARSSRWRTPSTRARATARRPRSSTASAEVALGGERAARRGDGRRARWMRSRRRCGGRLLPAFPQLAAVCADRLPLADRPRP